MYGLLSLFTGVLIAVMIVLNGGLTAAYGAYSATVMIHVAGLTLITLIILIKKERPFRKRAALTLYLGGALGVLTTVFNNLAYGGISVCAMLALGLFGQSLTGLVFDQFGLMGMPVRRFRAAKLAGLLLVTAGIVFMLDGFQLVPVVLAFLSGVILVISRTLNARLAEETSLFVSTFYNYTIGLIVAVPVFLLLGRGEPFLNGAAFDPRFYIYFGGIVGVAVVYLTNATVTKISAFYLTLFLFVGQVFSGVILDAIRTGAFEIKSLIGGFLVTAGLVANLVMDRKNNVKWE